MYKYMYVKISINVGGFQFFSFALASRNYMLMKKFYTGNGVVAQMIYSPKGNVFEM